MRKYLSLMALGAVLMAAAPADAQAMQQGPVCDKRANLLAALDKRFAEKPESLGLTGNGTVVELLTSEDGSWTLLVTSPRGISCMMASGEHWSDAPKPTAGMEM